MARRDRLIATLGFSLVAGCGGGGSAMMMMMATDGGAPADLAEATGDLAPPPLSWSSCGGRYECATMPAPLDYAVPAGRTIDIAVLRLPARKPDQRIGTLFFNPGGPGGPSKPFVKSLVNRFAQTAPQLLDRFDLMGFDWRGVGDSMAINCSDGPAFDALRQLPLQPTDANSAMPLESYTGALVARCQMRYDADFLAHLDTESAARDMDRLRAAMGEAKLNYWGISYGTWLGATYATLFPGGIRAFVLDSAVAPEKDRRDGTRSQSEGYEEALSRFFAGCVADAGCSFKSMGQDAAAIGASFDQLVMNIAAKPLATKDPGGRTVGPTDLHFAVQTALRGYGWGALQNGLADAAKGDGTILLELADGEVGRNADGTYTGFSTANLAIGTLDLRYPDGFTTADYWTFAAMLAAAQPRMGEFESIIHYGGMFWPVRRPKPPMPIGAPTAPRMLVVGGKHDPATPYVLAQALVAALANQSHLLTYEGDGHGGTLLNDCAGAAAVAFLLDPTITPPANCAP